MKAMKHGDTIQCNHMCWCYFNHVITGTHVYINNNLRKWQFNVITCVGVMFLWHWHRHAIDQKCRCYGEYGKILLANLNLANGFTQIKERRFLLLLRLNQQRKRNLHFFIFHRFHHFLPQLILLLNFPPLSLHCIDIPRCLIIGKRSHPYRIRNRSYWRRVFYIANILARPGAWLFGNGGVRSLRRRLSVGRRLGFGFRWRRVLRFDGVGNGLDWNGLLKERIWFGGRREWSELIGKRRVEMGRVVGEIVAASLRKEKLQRRHWWWEWERERGFLGGLGFSNRVKVRREEKHLVDSGFLRTGLRNTFKWDHVQWKFSFNNTKHSFFF